MYCPSCDQSFGETHSRCPQCHCWLKPGGKPGVKVEADAGKSSWLSAGSSDGPGWKLPEDVPEEYGWDAPSAAPVAEASRGWAEGAPEPKRVEDSGWDYEEPSASSFEHVGQDEDWVDEEFGSDYEEDDSSYLASTQRIDLTEEAAPNPFKFLLAVCIAMAVLSLVYLQVGPKTTSAPSEDLAKKDALQSAEIWISSARESVAKKQFEEAVLQYKQAVEFLKQGDADREHIVRARVEYSDALVDLGDYLSAHEQIFQVSSDISDGKERLTWIEGELVHESISQLKQARKLLATQPKESVILAEGALEVFLIFNASNSRVAEAYDVMARAYLNLGQVTAAAENVKDAMRWESSPDRLALFTELFPSAPPPEVKAERRRPVKIQASLGDPGGPPPGKRQRRQSYKKNREPVVVVPQPAQTRPPEHKPNYDKFRQKKSERLGHNPLTD